MSNLSDLRPLDMEQAAAIAAYAHENGRTWKTRLHCEWLRASADPILHGLRNTHGAKWLHDYHLPTARLPGWQHLRLIIDGVTVPTTAMSLQRRASCAMVQQLLIDFENVRRIYIEHGRAAPIGHGSTYYDANDKPHDLQIDLA